MLLPRTRPLVRTVSFSRLRMPDPTHLQVPSCTAVAPSSGSFVHDFWFAHGVWFPRTQLLVRARLLLLRWVPSCTGSSLRIVFGSLAQLLFRARPLLLHRVSSRTASDLCKGLLWVFQFLLLIQLLIPVIFSGFVAIFFGPLWCLGSLFYLCDI